MSVFVIREGQRVSQRVRTRIHNHKGRKGQVLLCCVDCSRPTRTAIEIVGLVLSKQFEGGKGVLSRRKIRLYSEIQLRHHRGPGYLWHPTLENSPLSSLLLPFHTRTPLSLIFSLFKTAPEQGWRRPTPPNPLFPSSR